MSANVAGRQIGHRNASIFQSSVAKGLPLIVGLSWLVMFPAIIPSLGEDRGIFVSVAERLLAGDTLYLDVWDNKDPLFYYTIALGRRVSPYADILLELLWVFAASAAANMIARWRGCNDKAAIFSGFVLTPIIVTGGMYIAGMTHLPGIAVALMATAVALRGRYTIAGTLLAVLGFLKVVMLPVALVMVIAVILLRRQPAQLVSLAAGFALAASLVALALQVRGELIPYFHSLVLNVSYSQGTEGVSGLPSVWEHLLRVVSLPFLLTLTTLCVGLVISLKAKRRTDGSTVADVRARTLFACQVLALCSGLAVLTTTGMWNHHGQILYVAAVLLVADLVTYTQESLADKPTVVVIGFLCFGLLLSGTPGPERYYESLTTLDESVAALTEPSLEARSILSIAAQGNYARVGQNFDGGHAYGLSKWNLVCPRFHQYPFDSGQHFQNTVECLDAAEVILMDSSAAPIPGQEKWNEYLEQVDALLEAEYLCDQEQEKVCTRR